MEQAKNNNQILMPHDSRGLVMIYGGAKEKEDHRRKKAFED